MANESIEPPQRGLKGNRNIEALLNDMTYGVASPDRHQAWPKEWLPLGAIPAHGEKFALDVGRLNAHICTSFQLVLEHKESMHKRGLASPDDGDTLALTLAQPLTAFHGWEEPARISAQNRSAGGFQHRQIDPRDGWKDR